MLKKLTF